MRVLKRGPYNRFAIDPEASHIEREERVGRAAEIAQRFLSNVETVVLGKAEEIKLVLTAMTCGGHVLLEDVPGTAKTVLARSIARSISGATTSRIQCTPDLQPADVTGLSVYDQKTRTFEFRPGPIFANIVLVDEINRATPKTQSALLEAMAEQQVTVDGVTRPLPDPFLLIATENPIEYEGTFPLPEAQLDRFMVLLRLGYPSPGDEAEMLAEHAASDRVLDLEPVAEVGEVLEAQAAAGRVHASEPLRRYVVAVLERTREDTRTELGASPRAGLMLLKAAKALAAIEGRDHALPDDVQALAVHVLTHRLLLAPDAVGVERADVVRDALERVPAL